MCSHVEVVITCTLVLSSGIVLVLEKTFYVPSFSKNLISVSRLVPLGYSFNFYETSFNLIYKSEVIGYGTLSDGLFFLDLQNNTTHNAIHIHTRIKICFINENFSMLWPRRLGHISIERIKRLVNDRVLNTLDFTDFETCVDCIKGKLTDSHLDPSTSGDRLIIVHNNPQVPMGVEQLITMIP